MKRCETMSFLTASLCGAVILVGNLWCPGSALAVQNIFGPNCPGASQQTTANAVLQGDLAMFDGGVCISLGSGKNLDLNGHSILCQDGNGCSGTAVDGVSGSGSVVFDGSIGQGSGTLATAISDVREVHTMVISTSAGPAISGPVRKIHDNNIASNGWAIDVTQEQNTDFIRNNSIIASGFGIRITGRLESKAGLGPIVEDNDVSVLSIGIEQVGSTREIRAFNNLVLDLDAPNTVPFVVANPNLAAAAGDPDRWLDNSCSDAAFCDIATPTCPPGLTPTCSASGIPFCQ